MKNSLENIDWLEFENNAYSKGFVDVPLLRKHLKELNDIENRLWAELKPGDK